MPRFRAFSGVMGGFKSAWRVYINDNKDFYPVLIMGKQEIIHDLLRHVFAKAKLKPAIRTSLPLKVICVARKISTRQLRRLRLGELIILMTKRHPINEPLVIIGDTIVCHTILNGMELHLIKDPSLLKDVEELNMTIHDDDINALSQRQSEEFNADETQANSALVNAMNDYKVTVTFELNRLDMATHLIEQLREGSVINLQKEITEDIFLTVSGRTIAVGEVVQVGRNFGVLIKEIF
jgi:flagellar motor switch/type III secretory pathway protein FliN